MTPGRSIFHNVNGKAIMQTHTRFYTGHQIGPLSWRDVDNVSDAEMSIFVITSDPAARPMVASSRRMIASHDAAAGVRVLNHLLPLPPPLMTFRGGGPAGRGRGTVTMIPLAFVSVPRMH